MVFHKYKRAEGYELKEQPEGSGGKLPATDCGYRGRKGERAGPPGATGRRGIIRLTSLSTTWARTTDSISRCAGDARGKGEEARMRTENNFHRLR